MTFLPTSAIEEVLPILPDQTVIKTIKQEVNPSTSKQGISIEMDNDPLETEKAGNVTTSSKIQMETPKSKSSAKIILTYTKS